MVDISVWILGYKSVLLEAFNSRVVFIGLQGSYARGEASENSDIDPVFILDKVSPSDLQKYREITSQLPRSELLCGFVSGRDELSSWMCGELFQFYYDTIPVYGKLEDIIRTPGAAEAMAAINSGACGLYHSCSHNFLHSRDVQLLKALFKSAVFTLKAKYFIEHGKYVRKHADLFPLLAGDDSKIMEVSLCPATINYEKFDELSYLLLSWSSRLISQYS